MKEHDRSWIYNPPYLLSKKESSTNSNLAGSNNVIIIFRDGSGEGVRRAKDKSKGADARLSGNKSKGTSGIIERGAIRRAPPRSLIIEARNRKELLTRGGTIEPALRGTIQRNKWFVVICTQWAPTGGDRSVPRPWAKDEWGGGEETEGGEENPPQLPRFSTYCPAVFDETGHRPSSADWDARSETWMDRDGTIQFVRLFFPFSRGGKVREEGGWRDSKLGGWVYI